MPSTVEVQMQLDDSGVVQRIEAQGQAYEQVAQSANEASEATERQANAAQESATASERGADAQREQAQAAEMNANAQQEAAQSARQYAAASDQMAGSAGNASQVIFSTGDAIQDAQFGLAGAANNIAFVAESFAQLQNQAGGTRGAFASLGSALTGPAGVILGLQALLALGPQLASWFSSRESEADALGEAYSSAAEDLLSFGEDVEGFEVEGLEQAEEARDTLQERLDLQEQQVSNLETLLKVRTATGAEQAQLTREERQTARQTRERLGLQNASTEAIRQAISEKQKEVRASESAVKQAKTLVRQRKAALQVEQALSDTDASREDSTSPREEIEKRVGALESLNEVSEASGATFEDNLSKFDFNEKQRETIRKFRDQVKGVGEDGKEATVEMDNLAQVASGALASGFQQFGAAIGEGQKAMQAFGKAAASILSQIGQSIGKQLIAQGTAMVAAGNPTGAAYIAAGGTIIAASGALSSIAGGSAGGASRDGGDRAPAQTEERGAELQSQVDVPGRRMGGPVEGGRLYRTHGLGQREFFRPSIDGQIVTAGAMRAAAGGGQGGAMTVNVEADGQISAEDFDIASLRAELNELSADVSDLT
jgi:hypothetical protein